MSASGQPARSAFHGNTFPVAIDVLPRHGSVFEREANVVGDEQIKMAVAVVVQKTTPGAPTRLIVPEAGGLGYISKRSVTIVAVKVILSEAGAEDILKPIVVVIADAYRRGPVHRSQSGFLRNIGEGAIPIVLVEVVRRIGRGAVQASAGQQEDVHPAIVVIVHESAATAGGFQNVFLAFHAAIDRGRGQPCRSRNVCEACVEGPPGRSESGQGFRGMGG